ncbi:MAG: CopD family protein [Paracoccaceae bacterium]
MGSFLAEWYLWTKALHIVAVIAWMAGLFYLPRLFVYHSEQVVAGTVTDGMFLTMERRLMRAIMVPAMVATWAAGVALVLTPGIVDWGLAWPWAKAVAVGAMSVFHLWLAARGRDFARGENRVTGRSWRMMNEVPTVLLLVIVVSVVVKF